MYANKKQFGDFMTVAAASNNLSIISPIDKGSLVLKTLGTLANITVNGALVSFYLHLLAPKFSPILWLFGYKPFDESQFSPEDAATVKKVQERIDELRQKMGISQPIPLMVGSKGGIFKFEGHSGIPFLSSPVFVANLDLLTDYEPSEEEDAVICRQLAHIKNHQSFKFATILAAQEVAITAILLGASSYIAGISLALLYTSGVFILPLAAIVYVSQNLEKQADLDAAKTVGSAQGLISILEKIQKHNLEVRESSWKNKLLINSDGDRRHVITMPSLKSRIQYLKDFEERLANPAIA